MKLFHLMQIKVTKVHQDQDWIEVKEVQLQKDQIQVDKILTKEKEELLNTQ